jgi:predicted transposase/invertase (TIGR01784 family)
MEFTFVELPKFKLERSELKTLIEKWVFFIKNAENLEVVPENITDAGLISAYEEANVQTWTQEELDAYEYAFMREEDDRARLDKAEQKGAEQNKISTILKLNSKGRTAEEISDLLDISLEIVQQVLETRANK